MYFHQGEGKKRGRIPLPYRERWKKKEGKKCPCPLDEKKKKEILFSSRGGGG